VLLTAVAALAMTGAANAADNHFSTYAAMVANYVPASLRYFDKVSDLVISDSGNVAPGQKCYDDSCVVNWNMQAPLNVT
jgi:hypothetical protein